MVTTSQEATRMAGKVVWTRRQERYPMEERAETGERIYKAMDGQYHTELATVHAGNKEPSMGGVWLREHFNYPGGPGFGVEHLPKAEQQWPVVTLHVALPIKRMDLRDALTAKLKAMTEDFLEEHKLLGE